MEHRPRSFAWVESWTAPRMPSYLADVGIKGGKAGRIGPHQRRRGADHSMPAVWSLRRGFIRLITHTWMLRSFGILTLRPSRKTVSPR